MATSQISDQILFDALVERGMAEKEQLEALLSTQREAFEAHKEPVAGTRFLIDIHKRHLLIQSHPDGRDIKSIPLSEEIKAPKFDVDDWERWGNRLMLANLEDGNRQSEFEWDLQELYGLVVAPENTYLYNNGTLHSDYLGLAKHALYGGIYKGKVETRPFDLFLSPDRRWLCVTDRGAGTLTIIATEMHMVGGSFNIRSPGSSNAINVALDDQFNKAYITDNQSSSLHIFDLETLEMSKQRIGRGILGNVVMAPDGKHLYVISIKPNVGLHYISTQNWETEKSIKLKGDLFKADSSDPVDLLSVSPNGEHVLIMTYLNDPEPFTPVISVINAENARTIRRYSIKDGIKPCQLAYALNNPVHAYTRPLEELIVQSGDIVSARDLWALKRELLIQMGEDVDDDELPPKPKEDDEIEEDPENEEEENQEEEEDNEEPEFLEIEQQIIDIADTTKNDPDSDELNITPQKVAKIDLPPAAVDEIADILLTTFQKQAGDEVAEDPDVQARIRQESEEIRKQLEEYDSTIVQIENLYEGQSLKTVIVREAIVMMLELRESAKQSARLVPTHCPNCNGRLMGSWDCQTCGFELESPDRAQKRLIASAEATANLPRGHVVIPDPQGLRLLQLNPYKYVAWNLDPDQLSADYPVDTLWTPDDRVLVVDKDKNAVLEVGLRGKVYWHFDTTLSEQHALNEPVKVTYFIPQDVGNRHYLIVDHSNHRVLEVNRQCEIIKEFGVKGVPGHDANTLNLPSDVQFTHDETYLIADTGNNRVIEYKKDGGIEEIYGEDLGLKYPTAAQRLFDNTTLILDAGNYRLILLNSSGEIIHESKYFTPQMDPEFRVVAPIKMIRLINKDIMIMDEDKIIQVMLSTNQLVWLSKIEDLAFQPQVEAPEVVIDDDGRERLVYKVVDHGDLRPVRLSQKINFKRMQKLIAARMRKEIRDGDEEDDKSSNAADRLRALIEDRKLEQKKSLRKTLTMDTFQPSEIFQRDEDLANIRHYALDRHHNAVIRINRKGEVKWHYGFEMGQVLSRPHRLSETRRTLLVADTGHNRVVEISKADKEVIMEFQGPESSKLSGPRCAVRLGLGKTLIADQRNKRLVELNSRGEIIWEFNTPGQISSPQYVEELESGHILFVDSMLNSIREINREGKLCWSYGSRIKGKGPGQLFAPEQATRLANGNTLIADTRNNRVIEVTLEGREVWMYEGDPIKRKRVINPNQAQRLENGNTLITYNNHRELIEVDAQKNMIWYFKMGNDVFQPPVSSDAKNSMQATEEINSYYNPIEKRLLKSAESKAMWGMEVHVTMMENVQMKSVRASMVLMALEKVGTVLKTFPSPEELLADKFGRYIIVAFILDAGTDPESILKDLNDLAEITDTKIERITTEEPAAAAS